MPGKRTFRTESGDYNEDDLSVVVWMNPEHAKKPQSRLLETLTSAYSLNPMAFPTRVLLLTLQSATLATSDLLAAQLLDATEDNPLVIPLTLAKSHLGWDEFYIPSAYETRTP